MNLVSLIKIALALVIALIFLLLASFIPKFAPNWLVEAFENDGGGIVIVDSPEVYSRERLINDRFEQSLWLTKQLDAADKEEFGNQVISDLRNALKIESSSKLVSLNTEGHEIDSLGQDDKNESKGTVEENGGKKDLTVTPIERFRDMLAYREEIRTEMLETMLDDRHDIEGNTLYRLKFDVTVLPESDVDKLTVVQVKLIKPKYCRSYPTSQGSYSSAVKCINDLAVFDDWLALTEEDINSAVENTILDFQKMNLDRETFVGFSRFLNRSTLNQSIDLTKNKFFDRFLDLPQETQQFEIRDFLRAERNSWLRQGSINQFCAQDTNARIARAQETDIKKNGNNTVENDDAISRPNRPNKAEIEKFCRQPAYQLFELLHGGNQQSRYLKLQESLHHYYLTNYLGDSNKPVVSKWVDQIRLMVERNRSPKENMWDDVFVSMLKTSETIELALLRNAVVDFWIDRYSNWQGEDRARVCKNLGNSNWSGFKDINLDCFAEFNRETCTGEVYHCTIKLKARKGNISKDDSVVDKFETLLSTGESFYSYAITPKESAQRIHFHETDSRRKILAMSLIAKHSKGLDSTAIEHLTQLISEDASRVDSIQRNPLILSFGRGQPVLVKERKEHRLDTQEQETAGKNLAAQNSVKERPPVETDFGWILGPRFISPSLDKSAKSKYAHTPVQNALSSVVSIPSWWTAVNLEIDTCWIDPEDISPGKTRKTNDESPPNGFDNICNSKTSGASDINSFKYTVRLPGSPAELPRKFGYRIERAPSIKLRPNTQYLADFYVGQENASLIIEGNELWRSTVVTIGNQKANEIVVLPNMKGIMATFYKIGVPHGRILQTPPKRRFTQDLTPCSHEARVSVWTSEGKTIQNAHVRIFDNEKLVKHPEGFSSCLGKPPRNPAPPNAKSDQSESANNQAANQSANSKDLGSGL